VVARRGFTLIELLVALAIVSLLLSVVVPRYFGGVERAEETVLKQNLAALRDAIDQHHADTGRYPAALDELVQKRYLRAIPQDPITRSRVTWIVVPPRDGEPTVYDIHSGAPGNAKDGSPYAQW
jgi:general secretion pathway protein G